MRDVVDEGPQRRCRHREMAGAAKLDSTATKASDLPPHSARTPAANCDALASTIESRFTEARRSLREDMRGTKSMW